MTEHVCGISGYTSSIDPPCPGCVEMNRRPDGTEWQYGNFCSVRVEDEDQPSPQVYVVLPGGEMMPCFFHADTAVNRKRAEFIAEAINDALRR